MLVDAQFIRRIFENYNEEKAIEDQGDTCCRCPDQVVEGGHLSATSGLRKYYL